jgi:predicted MPP superfamily phosphohydrolase
LGLAAIDNATLSLLIQRAPHDDGTVIAGGFSGGRSGTAPNSAGRRSPQVGRRGARQVEDTVTAVDVSDVGRSSPRPGVRTGDSRLARLMSRLEGRLFQGGWPVRLARAVGLRPQVRTVSHVLTLGPSAGGMPPLRIGYGSDFHAGPVTDPSVLQAACASLRAMAPDLVLLGGDFVTGRPDELGWLAHELGSIPAPLGRFAVLGNHDRWSGIGRIIEQLEAAGIRVLVNENVQLPAPYDRVWVCGLDDHTTGWPDAAAAFRGADGVRVVLTHAPSGLLDLGGERFDLALCGHTHGGQLALPGGVPLVVPEGRLSRRYPRGRFAIAGGGTLIVSVGLGCVVVPVRAFADPEIIACTLHREGSNRE